MQGASKCDRNTLNRFKNRVDSILFVDIELNGTHFQAVSIMADYIQANPDFVSGVVAWLIVSSECYHYPCEILRMYICRLEVSCGFSASLFSC